MNLLNQKNQTLIQEIKISLLRKIRIKNHLQSQINLHILVEKK